ncbi:DUF4062 domain-containing protein [Candidatus Uabimicrobium amorphum]|uniref:DUF4062 domain-containing protein n=1 Tax=Uabimicrobium amorphum TaxID=2596890 RepID=A0A5S9IIN5_UABAM|nr:DUF4062 domain-containing protein [Candidatus Uabimicrobium amorphum]BBM82374.1 hypothetical protein UABAM_00717 [Candidatus Uabimicrobium amorphum]
MKKWHVVRIFISSTFRDMHAEREEIVRGVLPALREECRKRRVLIEDIDLRWGVLEDQMAVDVCRQEIDRSSIFVCLLGERYGTIPQNSDISITHDEIQYGIFDSKEQRKCFFYLRKEQASEQIPEDKRSDYWETVDSKEAHKLQELKQQIKDSDHSVYEYNCDWDTEKTCLWDESLTGCFSNLQPLSQQMLQDLWNEIDRQYPEDRDEIVNPLAEEQQAMDYFIALNTKVYVGRQNSFAELHSFLDSTHNYLMVTGSSGSGKSACLAKFCSEYSENRTQLLYHFVGASADSTDITRLLQRMCYALSEKENILYNRDYHKLRKLFGDLLRGSSEKIVIVIDAVNQLQDFYEAHHLHWLPEDLPQNVKIIVSTLPGVSEKALRQRFQAQHCHLEPLTVDDRKQFIHDYLAQYGKVLDEESVNFLVQKEESAHPLYLKVALEECRTLGGNEIYREIRGILANLPQDVLGLFMRMFERLEKDPMFSEDLIQKFLCALALARGGLQIGELRIMLRRENEERLPALVWARLYHLLSSYLVIRGERLNFFHQQVYEAVEKKYDNFANSTHKLLAKFFMEQQFDYVRTLNELIYHLTLSKQWDKTFSTLTNLEFIENKCSYAMVYELLQDYKMVVEHMPSGIGHDTLHELQQALQDEFHNVLRFPQLVFQQLYNRCATNTNLRDLWKKGKEKYKNNLISLIARHPQQLTKDSPLLQTLPNNEHSVIAIDSNADNSIWVSAGADNEVKIWSSPQRQILRTLCGHTGMITKLCLSQDNSFVASASRDETIRIWNTTNGDEVQKLEGHTPTTSLCFTADNEFLLSTGMDKRCLLWDWKQQKILKEAVLKNEITAAIFNGKEVICGCKNGDVYILDEELNVKHEINAHPKGIYALALTANGSILVSAGEDQAIKVWDFQTSTAKLTIQEHEDWIYDLKISPKGSHIVSASGDKTIKIFNIETGECTATLFGHSDWVYNVAFVDDTTLISCSEDSTIRFWDITRAKSESRIGHSSHVSSIDINKNTQQVMTASFDKKVMLWNLQGEMIQTFATVNKALQKAIYSPDFKKVLAVGDDSIVHIWDENGEERQIDSGQEVRIFSACFSPDGAKFASASRDCSAKVWKVDSGNELLKVKQEDGLEDIQFAKSGKHFATCGRDKHICVWDAQSGERVARYLAHQLSIEQVCFANGDDWIVSAGLDNVVKVWEWRNTLLMVEWQHPASVYCIDMDENDRFIASGSADKTVRIFDTKYHKEVAMFVSEGMVNAIKLHNNLLIAGDEGGIVYFCDISRLLDS